MITIDLNEIKHKRDGNYPCLMISKGAGTIVLFKTYRVGTIVHGNKFPEEIGFYSSGWNMKEFEPYYGSLTLIDKEQNNNIL